MKKKTPNADWYTETHVVKHNPPLRFTLNDNPEHYEEIYFTHEKSKDGTIFSKSKYKTKFKREDLPAWYLPVIIFKHFGWINIKNITDIYYKPNMYVNHLFRDDFLYIKFDGKIDESKKNGIFFTDYDALVCGWDIIDVIVGCEILANKNNNTYMKNRTKEALEKVRQKVEYYNKEYSEEHDSITLQEFMNEYSSTVAETLKKIGGEA